MRPFEYCAPSTVTEALSLLREYGDRARPLAGGTDLLIFMQSGRVQPDYVVDLTRIAALKGIAYDPAQGLKLGALTSMREVELAPAIRAHYPALAASTFELAGVQVRNMATIGGNTCNASPAADTIPPLMALDAVAVIAGTTGERRVPYTELFQGPGKTALKRDELLASIDLPPPSSRTGSHYIKLAVRKAMDIAIVGVAASVTLDDGLVQDCRIALGAVGPTVIRAHEAEQLLRGKPLEDATLKAVAKAAQAAAKPITDQRGSAAYRTMMVGVLVPQALRQAAMAAQRTE
ncbi:MAG: xanthine dehydrogenase family protein subunit M [Candidatus Latescibacteria bacterium]|nr:xanthine dehydrogenase family protein subunit M [Candidatus Latescibacterota bacterium]